MKAFIMAIALFGLASAVQAEESVKEKVQAVGNDVERTLLSISN